MLSQAEIKKIIPHRDPFLFVDNVVVNEMGIGGQAEFNVRQCQPFWSNDDQMQVATQFQFLILEAAAQAFGVVMSAQVDSLASNNQQHLLLGFEKVTFTQVKTLPERIIISVQSEGAFNGMSKANFSANIADSEIASGVLSVMQREISES